MEIVNKKEGMGTGRGKIWFWILLEKGKVMSKIKMSEYVVEFPPSLVVHVPRFSFFRVSQCLIAYMRTSWNALEREKCQSEYCFRPGLAYTFGSCAVLSAGFFCRCTYGTRFAPPKFHYQILWRAHFDSWMFYTYLHHDYPALPVICRGFSNA